MHTERDRRSLTGMVWDTTREVGTELRVSRPEPADGGASAGFENMCIVRSFVKGQRK